MKNNFNHILGRYLPLVFLVLSAGIVWAGSTTLTTYYPAPTGNYNQVIANNVGIGVAVPLGILDVYGTLSPSANNWVYLRGNVGGSTPSASATQGLIYGWNPSGGMGESQILYATSNGGSPHLDFGRWSGSVKTIDMTLKGGNVGIGTTSPGEMLDISESTNSFALTRMSNTSTGTSARSGFDASNGSLDAYFGIIGSGFTTTGTFIPNNALIETMAGLTVITGAPITFAANGTTDAQMTIIGSGNVGIGTTAPLDKLHVVSGGGFGGENADGTSQAGGVSLVANGDSTQIGILNAKNRQAFALNIDGDGGTTGSRGYVDFYDKTDGNWHQDISLNNGNVGIGNTNPGLALDVTGDIRASRSLNVGTSPNGGYYAPGSIYSDSNWGMIFRAKQASPAVATFGFFNNANGLDFWITDNGASGTPVANFGINGNLTVTGNITSNQCITGTICPSDQRLKQNILSLTGTLSKLDQLRGVSFEWNHLATTMGLKEGKKSIGMIAQELQKVYPELVVASKNGHQEYLSVDYGQFTAVLLQSIKELKSQMNTMQDQINALQRKVKTLEKQK